MNVIDHAILIPASPAFIWRYIGDISKNENWQKDCSNISFLTTQHEGRGTRWRYTSEKGKDVVVEVTAWYDTLGYEYIIVDGASVSENKGRIRLQEIAEGTLVQWTFNYEVDGMLSNLRNSMGLKRTLTNNIQDSLRDLYKFVQSETGGISTHEAKSLLKEAPDVEQRSSYQPRHPSNFNDETISEPVIEPDYPSETPISYNVQSERIPEPPVADDDTKPNPVIQGTDDIPVVSDEISEPNFLHSIPEPPVADDDTKPNAPIIDTKVEEPAPDKLPIIVEPEPSEESLPTTSEAPEPENPKTSSIPPDKRDTATVSVFELFGLQKPSETQEMAALSDKEIAEAAVERVTPTPPVAYIIAEEIEDTPDIPQESPAEPDIPIDTGSIVAVEATESIADEQPQSTIIESDELNILEPDDDNSSHHSTGLRATLRRKLIQLRTR